tara:strand:+ start:19502 stop:19708 length:207 start_codon:yes stop_codon:yes gene_type:complete
MIGLSTIVMELASLGMFRSLESMDYNAISKDHIGDIQAIFNGQKIKVQVFSNDDAESVAKKIIEHAKF